MKGRKRKPYLVAKADGFTHHENRPPCPEASLGDYEPPFELDAVARKEWDRQRAEAPWILAVNALLLAMRCRAFAERQRATAQRDLEGMTVLGDRGQPVRHPLATTITQLDSFILRADAELGLTPCSQSRVAVPNKNGAAISIDDQMCGT